MMGKGVWIMAHVRQLSRHFVQRWTERVGAAPTLAGVNRILDASHKICGQKRLYEMVDGIGLRPCMQLAEYWCHKSAMILRIDEWSGTAVTVITPDRGR
jgi:hypothetical protein